MAAGNGFSGFGGDGGAATSAGLASPIGVAVDAAGHLYIADSFHNRIRRADAGTGIITTLAGNGSYDFSGDGGPATSASLRAPNGVAVDAAGHLYIADSNNCRIRRVDAGTGIITTIAGNGNSIFSGDGGPAANAGLAVPAGVAVDAAGHLYITSHFSHRIRRVDAGTNVITTVAGNGNSGFSGDGGPATNASMSPTGVTVDGAGHLYFVDSFNPFSHRIRRVDALTGIVTTVAGNGSFGFSGDGGLATSAGLAVPTGVALDTAGNLYIADPFNQRVRRVDASTHIINTVAGNGFLDFGGDGGPAASAGLNYPTGVAVDAADHLYIVDQIHQRIRRVEAGTGIITTVAGNGTSGFSGDGGPATSASFDYPTGVAVDAAGHLYIADLFNSRIRRVDAGTGIITTFAGNGSWGSSGDDGPATSARLRDPTGVAVDAAGHLYIADQGNHDIRRVEAGTGVITTVAGYGNSVFSGDNGPATSAGLNYPTGVAVDAAGHLYIADSNNRRIRRVDAGTGIITTVAGNGSLGFSGDGGPATSASFDYPTGVAVDAAGHLYVADQSSQRIRRVEAGTGVITTVAGNGSSGFSGDDGPATNATLFDPQGVAVDAAGHLYIADPGNQRIRRVPEPGWIGLLLPGIAGLLSIASLRGSDRNRAQASE